MTTGFPVPMLGDRFPLTSAVEEGQRGGLLFEERAGFEELLAGPGAGEEFDRGGLGGRPGLSGADAARRAKSAAGRAQRTAGTECAASSPPSICPMALSSRGWCAATATGSKRRSFPVSLPIFRRTNQ